MIRLTQRDMQTYSRSCPTLFQRAYPRRGALHPIVESMPQIMHWHESIAVLHSVPLRTQYAEEAVSTRLSRLDSDL